MERSGNKRRGRPEDLRAVWQTTVREKTRAAKDVEPEVELSTPSEEEK